MADSGVAGPPSGGVVAGSRVAVTSAVAVGSAVGDCGAGGVGWVAVGSGVEGADVGEAVAVNVAVGLGVAVGCTAAPPDALATTRTTLILAAALFFDRRQ